MKKVGRKKKCKECKKQYEVQRDWQLFCSTKCRSAFNRRFKQICFYCGESGNHRHHVNPRAYSGKEYFNGVEYVYCCSECNVTLSDHYFSHSIEAFEFLIDYYINKYDLLKPVVEWDDDEIEELGKTLKGHVRKALATRRRQEERVTYLKAAKTYLYNDEFDY